VYNYSYFAAKPLIYKDFRLELFKRFLYKFVQPKIDLQYDLFALLPA